MSQFPQTPDGQNPFASPEIVPAEVTGQDLGDDAALRMLLPVGRSGYAIAAGYLGLLSLGFCFLGPPAVVFGILAVRDIRRDPKKHGLVRAWLGIVLGTLGTIGLVFVVIAMIGAAAS